MGESGNSFEALRDAIDALAAETAPELVAEARAEAVARVRSMLTDAIAESLLDRAERHLTAGKRPPRPRPASSGQRRATATGSQRRARSDSSRERPGPSAATEDARGPGPEGDGYYVYGVAWAGGHDLPANVAGVDPSHPASLLQHAGLAAIVSRVSLAEFGEDQLHENLNDVGWLEEKARAHELVLDEALSRMTVVPMRLCTIYRGEEQVREMLVAERAVFADALRRLEGKAEWGVKLIAEPGALERAATAISETPMEEDAELSPGAAYMRGKSREAEVREGVDRIGAAWADSVHERLSASVSEALLNPLQNPEVSGHTGDMLLNGVYLVADDEAAVFHETVDELKREYGDLGAAVELTGPWPPYNFVKGSIEAAR